MTGNETGNETTGATPPAEGQGTEPNAPEPAEDPGYLTRTGEVAGEDGSVVPLIGGLPAVEGSAWDIGAPLEDRGADLAGDAGAPPDRVADEAGAQAGRAEDREPRDG
jgi:hypothetical protein